jgi:hypothetical protein
MKLNEWVIPFLAAVAVQILFVDEVAKACGIALAMHRGDV